jgi:hypothetical protein
VRGLVVLVVMLVLLLVAADRVAWWLAEEGVANAIQQSEDLPNRPEVAIGGFPFLTQALAGRYDQVDVRFVELPAEEAVTIAELDTRLSGVRVPLRDIIDQSVQQTPVDQASASARVSFDALNAAAAARSTNQLSAIFGPGSSFDQVSVTGTFRGPLGSVSLQGEARILVDDGSLVVTLLPDTLNLPRAVQAALARLIGQTYKLPPLPLDFKATSVAVAADGITVTAAAQDVVLGPAAAA